MYRINIIKGKLEVLKKIANIDFEEKSILIRF